MLKKKLKYLRYLKRDVHVIGFECNNVKVKMCKLEKIQTLLVNCEQTYQFIDCKDVKGFDRKENGS
jgi:hypothetical protein